ncbi:hypothetical protein [Nocardia farcinica]
MDLVRVAGAGCPATR